MTVGIVGLGLIGGSMAKAYKRAGHTVYAYDTNSGISEFAVMDNSSDGQLNNDNIAQCDLVLTAVYPGAAIEFISKNAPFIKKDALVMDLCGVKRSVCKECFKIAQEYGFTFVGGHPMAGSHNSGYKYSDADLFKDAPMVIVPPVFDDMKLLDRVKDALKPAQFAYVTATDADRHDKTIAFTSQLAHVVSNAYIKSKTAREHKGMSAGSYKDLTRVAWLNPQMWAELFEDNKDNLLFEIDTIINNLTDYRNAISDGDEQKLIQLLDDGRRIKEEVDGH